MPRRLLQTLTARSRSVRDRGAVAVVVALTITLVLAGAAFAVDISNLAFQRQQLQNNLDSAAQIGASVLPAAPAQAVDDATTYLATVEPKIAPDVSLWCVVTAATNPDTGELVTTQIPAQCNPGTAGPYMDGTDGVSCSNGVCAIPCQDGAHCNAISVKAGLEVAYYFGPAIGIPSHNTGIVTSTSCSGKCGKTSTTVGSTVFIQLP